MATHSPHDAPASHDSQRLREVAAVFLKLGATAFGGPAVHIALLEQEVVHRRKWLTHDEFLDLLGATNLIPGPNSTEMAIHIGLRRAGWRGLLVAGCCFILPAFLITLACAWFYMRAARVPAVQGVLYGVKPVVLAIVLQALWRLGRSAVKSRLLGVLAAVTLVANLLGVHELLLLLGAGLVVPAVRRGPGRSPPSESASRPGLMPLLPMGLTAGSTTAAAVSAGKLFLFFLKVGSVLYGSGYVLLAFMRADLVERWGWLSESQLLDAVAVGQVTPGPVFTTATFIGYVLAGGSGACLATAGIFLPAFFFVAISALFLTRLRRSPVASAFLDGVNAASLALMAAVTWQLGQSALTNVLSLTLFVGSAAVLMLTRLNPTWLIAAGAALGWAAF
jgi:chromate transporter